MCNRTAREYVSIQCHLDCVKTAVQSDDPFWRSIFFRITVNSVDRYARTTSGSVSARHDSRLPKPATQNSVWHAYSTAVVSEQPFLIGCVRHHPFVVSSYSCLIFGHKMSGCQPNTHNFRWMAECWYLVVHTGVLRTRPVASRRLQTW